MPVKVQGNHGHEEGGWGVEHPERKLMAELKAPYVAHLVGKEIWRNSQMNKSDK